ncbi:hypothetical protein NMP99_00775 [Glutamicibacter mishrai]|uniref:hypothetical protein n=1 Tax=Glutamicibacter mishrai TaxID=1775880 RepID=UPI0020CDD736|nr:hypothetical protein [Glutamicibacter mishrai]UTT39886.1 hypothetical protein NMP99_00775 [Glutamicibacter mishrai]
MNPLNTALSNRSIQVEANIDRSVEAEHTMGPLLAKYVLPKVPSREQLSQVNSVQIRQSSDIDEFSSVGKSGHKRFNWRRPSFKFMGANMACVVPPGADYTYHYSKLLETAAKFYDLDFSIQKEEVTSEQTLQFVISLLRPKIGRYDSVLLGYVESLFIGDDHTWEIVNGVGYRTVELNGFSVLILGFELSYWGDIGGQLVAALAELGVSDWVVYVGKLGTLDPGVVPNFNIATGTRSVIEGHEVSWNTRLQGFDIPDIKNVGVLRNQLHITEPSTLDETVSWLQKNQGTVNLVDPEIGRMASSAIDRGITFDYLHIVSDNLSGGYDHGLFDEHFGDVKVLRNECLSLIESILRLSFR